MISSVRSCPWTGAKVRIRLWVLQRLAWQHETRPYLPQLKAYLYWMNHSLLPTLCTTCHSLYRKYYTVNKWAISAAASASVYSEGAGASCSREHLIGQKIWWEVLAEVTNCKLWMFISAKCKFSHCFGAHRDTDNLQATILILTPQKTSILISWDL